MRVTVWKGHLTFGLVSMPVRLFRAARAERVSLRQLYKPTERTESAPLSPKLTSSESQSRWKPSDPVAPVKRVYEATSGGESPQPIASPDLVKGYEYAKDQYVVVEEQELRSIAPKTSTEMQIVEFVRFEEIDPIYLETSYYVVPDETGERAYALLFQAMREAGYAAIGQLAMHRRDHVMIVRTGKTGLIAHTIFYSDEVRTIDEFRTDTASVSAQELDLAKTLIQALASPFDPAKFKNQFRERLHELIDSRVARHQVTPVEGPTPAKAVDIMDALKQSLAEIKSADRASEPGPAKTQRKPARAETSHKIRTKKTNQRR